jgi:RNA polymerase sigma-70 factor (ECF subfamily)
VAAEELVQEVFRRALGAKVRPSPNTLEATRCWLFTVLRHLWQNELRRRSRQARAISALARSEAEVGFADAHINRKLLQSEVRQAIDSLSEPHREVVVLRDIEGFSYAEIASILSCPVGTVMSRLSRARECLRAVLAPPALDSRRVER